nr:hypothetical protein [Tanacetum cinerariifolium]
SRFGSLDFVSSLLIMMFASFSSLFTRCDSLIRYFCLSTPSGISLRCDFGRCYHTPEPSRRFNSICYDDDDNKESTIPLNEIISQTPPSITITPVLPIMELKNSLIMRDEDLRTILEKESDEFIKSSVEDLVPIPKESEDTSDSDKECDLPVCDNSVTFSNPLFDANDDFTSSNEGVLENIERKDSYVSNLDEPVLLVTLLSDANEDKCFDPRSLKDKPDNDDLKSMDKVFDPGIHEKIISPTYVRLPFEDRYYFSLTFVIRIFLPYLTYSMDSSLLLSSGSEDTIFDPGISVFSFCSLEPVVKMIENGAKTGIYGSFRSRNIKIKTKS